MTNLPFTSRSHDYVRHLASMSDQDFRHHAEQMAHTSTTPDLAEKYLVCQAGKGQFILPYAQLREVTLPPTYYTYLPSSPLWMHGLAAWHNEVIATVDFATYASQSPAHEHTTHMLVISYDDMAIGLLLNVIASASTLPPDPLSNTQPRPEIYTTFPCQDAIECTYTHTLVLSIPPLFTHLLHTIQGISA